MRFRTDNSTSAEIHGMRAVGLPLMAELAYRAAHDRLEDVPPAEPGDTWEVRWYGKGRSGTPEYVEGPIAGYAICCPKCRQVHRWTGALNCQPRDEHGSCRHSGKGSCWAWTGDAAAGTLTASPSLHATGACGWHGWLQNGDLREC